MSIPLWHFGAVKDLLSFHSLDQAALTSLLFLIVIKKFIAGACSFLPFFLIDLITLLVDKHSGCEAEKF